MWKGTKLKGVCGVMMTFKIIVQHTDASFKMEKKVAAWVAGIDWVYWFMEFTPHHGCIPLWRNIAFWFLRFRAILDIQRQVFLILIRPIFEEMSFAKRTWGRKKILYITKCNEKTSQNFKWRHLQHGQRKSIKKKKIKGKAAKFRSIFVKKLGSANNRSQIEAISIREIAIKFIR